MGMAYNLALTSELVRGATHALLITDTDRLPDVAASLDENDGPIASRRGFVTYRGRLAGKELLLVHAGFGGPAMATAVHELAKLGIRTFLKSGTGGAIQDRIDVGDVILCAGSMRLDGASQHYAPIGYPAVAHPDVLRVLVDAARAAKVPYHRGITVTTDTFYPGQERYDDTGSFMLREFRGSLIELKRLGILSYDLSTATLLTMAGVMRLRAGAIMGVVVNRMRQETVDVGRLVEAEMTATGIAVGAMRRLIECGEAEDQ